MLKASTLVGHGVAGRPDGGGPTAPTPATDLRHILGCAWRCTTGARPLAHKRTPDVGRPDGFPETRPITSAPNGAVHVVQRTILNGVVVVPSFFISAQMPVQWSLGFLVRRWTSPGYRGIRKMINLQPFEKQATGFELRKSLLDRQLRRCSVNSNAVRRAN